MAAADSENDEWTDTDSEVNSEDLVCTSELHDQKLKVLSGKSRDDTRNATTNSTDTGRSKYSQISLPSGAEFSERI
jgi:hypothetical protein